jgi:hypothetical protein
MFLQKDSICFSMIVVANLNKFEKLDQQGLQTPAQGESGDSTTTSK